MFRRFCLNFLLVIGLGLCGSPPALAQGLIWNAPAEGTWVRYEGDYTQFDDRPNDPVNKRLKLGPWRRHLTLKALKKTQAEYQGATVDCQWFEIKVITASEKGGDGTLKPGPGGQRIYKVLVPVDRITGPPVDGKVVDKDSIPVAFLPVVKGYRRFGERPVEPITSGVLQTYPMISLLAYYRTMDEVAQGEDPQVGLAGVTSATHYRGELTMENPSNRSVNKADIWTSDQVPFGLVRWKVEVVRHAKDGNASRDDYQATSTFNVDIKIQEQGTGATSDLAEE